MATGNPHSPLWDVDLAVTVGGSYASTGESYAAYSIKQKKP